MALSSAISAAKKTYAAALWAANKVNAVRSYAIQKMGGVAAVAGVIFAAVKAYTFNTVGKAMGWIEAKLATAIPIVIGFLASMVGQPEKGVLREILEELT
jgi:hypothetical protein